MKVHTPRLLHDPLLVAAANTPDKTALMVEGKPYTYSQFAEAALKMATALQTRGMQRGDRVAIYMDNTWACAVSVYGISLAGGVFLVINPQTKQDKLEYIFNDCGAQIFLTDGHLAKFFEAALSNMPALTHIICSGELPDSDFNSPVVLEPFQTVLDETEPLSQPSASIPTDLAALIYTSGSTGNPKGVMMTHQAMFFTMGSLVQYLRLTAEDRIINVLPFAFDYGLYQLLMTVKLGATILVERSFTYPTMILKRLEEHHATVFPGVPTIYATLISMHKRSPLSFPSIKRITNTAAALSPELIPHLQEIFPNALIFKMYGLTECKRVSYLEPELLQDKITSVGKAIPGTEMFLLSPEGNPVPPGEHGILHVRGPHVMLGYWKQPELSKQMLKEGPLPGERILCAQDWFVQDEEGFFYFKGRSDDIIKTRGEKVSPIEVENALLGIPGIKEAAVLGAPHNLFGEMVVGYISLEEGSTLNEKQIKKICMSKLENFMVPQEIKILKELPKTDTGKIRKKGLAELVEESIAA